MNRSICGRYLVLAYLALIGNTIAEEPACDIARWSKAITKFEAADKSNQPRHEGVLFVGSSSIRLWDLTKYFPDLRPLNRGFGGSEICHSTHYLDQLVVKHRPRLVVVYAGGNDMANGKNAKQVHRDFGSLWKKLHQSLPKTNLVYIAIKPSRSRWKLATAMADANSRIAADCDRDDQLTFVDIWQPMLGKDGLPREELFVSDGLHLSATGYELWSSMVKPHLAK